MKKIFLALLLPLFIAGCSMSGSDEGADDLTNAVASKEKEVIDIHDRVMTKLPKLGRLSKSLMEVGEEQENSLEYYSHSGDVDLAKERMMNWMREYQTPETLDMSPEERLEYLEKEKKKISDIEVYTNKVIEKGEKMMEEAN